MNRVHVCLLLVLVAFIAASIYAQLGYQKNHAKGEIAFVGDINNTEYGNLVLEAIDELDPTDVILLGDVCYHGNCYMLEKYQSMFGDKLKCILGNHDSRKIVKDLCEKPWSFERDGVLLIGLNTQGNLDEQHAFAKQAIQNTATNNIIIVTHEPCVNSHNNNVPNGLYSLCYGLRSLHENITFIAGHHHIMSLVVQDGMQYYTAGSGGGFLQNCAKSVFTFCSKSFGFLAMDYPKFTFYDTDDEVLYQK